MQASREARGFRGCNRIGQSQNQDQTRRQPVSGQRGFDEESAVDGRKVGAEHCRGTFCVFLNTVEVHFVSSLVAKFRAITLIQILALRGRHKRHRVSIICLTVLRMLRFGPADSGPLIRLWVLILRVF